MTASDFDSHSSVAGDTMSTSTIRMPQERHARLRHLAKARGISINRLVEELSTVASTQHDTDMCFRALAARGSKKTGWRHWYTYPDVSVVCGEPQLADEQTDTLLNPALSAEVLSPSTEGYDRGRKFEHYRAIASLGEYLLVAQDRVHVDLHTRQQDGRWVLSEAGRIEDSLELPSIGCHLVLADLYEKVDLTAHSSLR